VRERRLFVQARQQSAIPGREVATFLGRDAGLVSRMEGMDEAERAQFGQLLGLKSRNQADLQAGPVTQNRVDMARGCLTTIWADELN
jgi:hypothetical protein